jgi:hypothetical protein
MAMRTTTGDDKVYTDYVTLQVWPFFGSMRAMRVAGLRFPVKCVFGGQTTVCTLETTGQEDYLAGLLHPSDVKLALARDINVLLEPVRRHFATDAVAAQLLADVKQCVALPCTYVYVRMHVRVHVRMHVRVHVRVHVHVHVYMHVRACARNSPFCNRYMAGPAKLGPKQPQSDKCAKGGKSRGQVDGTGALDSAHTGEQVACGGGGTKTTDE